MVHSILAATDLSDRSRFAVERAAHLARICGARLLLLHVVELDRAGPCVERESAQSRDELLTEAARLAALTGIEAEVKVIGGDPIEAIGNAATDVSAAFVVMGRHRPRPLRDLFAGTTIERVMWRGTHPVLMVKRSPDRPYRRVAVAVDCSQTSAHALRSADSLGFLEGTSAAVIHAHIPFAKTMLSAHSDPETVATHVSSETRLERDALVKFLRTEGFERLAGSLFIETGDALQVIQRYAELDRPDLLVIGTHNRGGLGRMFLGSVADQVLRAIDCDILAVPPRTAAG